ncbi:CerR family C-terminal domain-containing protein [Rhizobium sp. C4]|uniref:CerR family C-terminal domain-containing protein n=1 Tax=Rhizobium sp. C4 TaxID=1349800 RepID=UPI001E31E64A|nr:CerR family C-terminal domain-containing protein [Rhizobium sp. C4]MCD2173761.1 CerR family C-terminal domain-containing protein [Rhizobium sp. C4]
MTRQTKTGGEATRVALIEAALKLFGAHGYDAVSTRQIADAAEANIGSIAYHFGGKPGLRMACAEFVANRITNFAAPAIATDLPTDPQVAMAMMDAAIERFARFLVSSRDAGTYAAFMLREIMQPGEVVDYIYDTLISRAHMRLCGLFGVATGLDPESQLVKAAVFSLLGQVLYFRVARPIVLKRMDWADIGPAEADELVDVFKTNLKGLIAAHRKG